MKLIVNENFQFRGMHRAGVSLTVPRAVLQAEIDKGRHPNKRYGRHPWMSGLIEHCTPANQETADFIEKASGEKVEPVEAKHDEQDDSAEIRDIWAEFESIGKGYDKRWKLKRLRSELIKAKKAIGERRESVRKEATIRGE